MAIVKKITKLEFGLVVGNNYNTYVFKLGKHEVTIILELPEYFLIVYKGNKVQGFQREFVPSFRIEFEDVEVPDESAKKESSLILPTSDGKVVSLDEARQKKNAVKA